MTVIDRKYIRHPSGIPLEYCLTEQPPRCNMDYVHNISVGGLSFHSQSYIAPEQWVHIYIPINEEYFETDAKVRWCESSEFDDEYDVGVSFCDSNQAFAARMVEQICHIEDYKYHILKHEGRSLTSDQAASEWIEKYASHFPPTSE